MTRLIAPCVPLAIVFIDPLAAPEEMAPDALERSEAACQNPLFK